VDSEVGRLRAVIVHRPGAELKRVLPRQAGQLLFAGLPWAARAQQEHDIFTQVLRDHGVQVLYLTELLQDVLEYAPARQQAIMAALGSVLVGDELAGLAHTVLAVPLGHPDRRLDTICTMLNGDTVLMRPAAAYSLTARCSPRGPKARGSRTRRPSSRPPRRRPAWTGCGSSRPGSAPRAASSGTTRATCWCWRPAWS
jgi:arginine deiminase